MPPYNKVCSHCGVEKPIGEFKRLTGYRKTRDKQCRDCYRVKLESKIQFEMDAKLRAYSLKVSKTVNRTTIEKATRELLKVFGGAEKFAEAFYDLYERIKHNRDEDGRHPSAYMVIAVLRLCDAAGQIQEEAMETDARHEELYGD